MTKSIAKSAPGKLRIIAGRLRNSRIAVPDLPGLRPTAERVRETVFNWLAPVIEGSRCLDLFAGTGALGLEACSRGAAEVHFIERDRHLVRLLQDNLTRLNVTGVQIHNKEALSFLYEPAQPFDIVFLDPPFAENHWAPVAQALQTRGWLKETALVYVESQRNHPLSLPMQWQPHREGHAGLVRYGLYRVAGPSVKL